MTLADTSVLFSSSTFKDKEDFSVFLYFLDNFNKADSIALVSSSIPFPPRPITNPGFATFIKIRQLDTVRSMPILSIPALLILSLIILRITTSSSRRRGAFLSKNHLEAQSELIQSRNEFGLIFCPIIIKLISAEIIF